MYGTVYQLDDGRWQLRFKRTLAHPQSKVWRAITEPEQLAHWFPTTIDGRRETGAPLRFTFPGGEAPPFDGEMLAFVPESVMELRWGPDVVRIELEPVGDRTALTLLDTLEKRGKAARDSAGWHTCLDALEAGLRADPDARGRLNEWGELHRKYVESFGPEAATIGPPDSG